MNIQTNSEFLSNLKEISSKIGSGNELSQQSVDLDEKVRHFSHLFASHVIGEIIANPDIRFIR